MSSLTNLPEAWKERRETTAQEIAGALSAKVGEILPWLLVRDALTATFNARFVERAGGGWPCDCAGAGMVRVKERSGQASQEPKPPASGLTPLVVSESKPLSTAPGVFVTEAALSAGEIQDLNDRVAAVMNASVDVFGAEPRFLLCIETKAKTQPTQESLEKFH